MEMDYKANRGITYNHIQPLDKIQKQNTIQEHIQKETLQKYVSLNTKTVQEMLKTDRNHWLEITSLMFCNF